MSDTARIRSALSAVPPYDRDTWVRMGMAVKAELGADGWDIWDEWSKRDESYDARDARDVWKSLKSTGGITGGTLISEARSHGWEDDSGYVEPSREQLDARRKRHLRQAAAEAEMVRRNRARAALEVAEVMKQVRMAKHPYLERKGFPDLEGMVVDLALRRHRIQTMQPYLLVPMRQDGKIVSCQTIAPCGEKMSWPGGALVGTTFSFVPGRSIEVLCEGYATGLSIDAALRNASITATVTCCFTAGNLAAIAQRTASKARRVVVADHDEGGAGLRAAEATGLPYWMPQTIGHDANDAHRAYGLFKLGQLLKKLIYGRMGR